jgi:hypothetical protein
MRRVPRLRVWTVLAVVLIGGRLAADEQDLEQFATAIMPRSEELKWQRIPWLTDLAEGQRLARAEQRPIFLWVTGDDPLERC